MQHNGIALHGVTDLPDVLAKFPVLASLAVIARCYATLQHTGQTLDDVEGRDYLVPHVLDEQLLAIGCFLGQGQRAFQLCALLGYVGIALSYLVPV